jgi:hypothetical protein
MTKLGRRSSGQRIKSEPDLNPPAIQENVRASGIMSHAAKEAEATEVERPMRRRGKKRKDLTGREEPNGRPPDLVTYSPK